MESRERAAPAIAAGPPTERRRRRSTDPLVALHHQLSYARRLGALDTIVIADDSGVVVAGAGSWAACEELAAYAPYFLEENAHGAPLARLRGETVARRLHVGGATVIVCATGATPDGARSAVDRATEGAARILAA